LHVSFVDNVLTLREKDSDRSAGILISQALSQLVKMCPVTLVARLDTATEQRSKKVPRTESIQKRPIRILVHGRITDKDVVARVLDEGGLFLQRPEEYELDRGVRYFNPMYLLPPGEDLLGRGEGPSVTNPKEPATTTREKRLGENEKTKILSIFDNANGRETGSALGLKQSVRITSKLKE